MAPYAPVKLRTPDDDALILLDQRLLPATTSYLTYTRAREIAVAIRDMVVRGAPAIGATAAFGLALEARAQLPQHPGAGPEQTQAFVTELANMKQVLWDSRPTAVHLMWALERMWKVVMRDVDRKKSASEITADLMAEAKLIAEEDVLMNKAIGDYGAALVPQNAKIIHHCNTGALATIDWGTALGVIRTAYQQGKVAKVWVDETRPRLQGARLTAWELKECNIPYTIIVDGASGLLMRRKQVDLCTVGADRIAANGDTANKIGTYNLAAAAKDNQIPFYVCATLSIIDMNTKTGDDIIIEERDPDEVIRPSGESLVAPQDSPVYNPAFDITPARLISGIITEKGVIYPPFSENIPKFFQDK